MGVSCRRLNYTHNLHMDNFGLMDLFTQRTGTMEAMWETEGAMETVAVGWKFAHLIANVTVKIACVIVVGWVACRTRQAASRI
jgi:hypothetical protein